jgi:hypothetical protein
MTSNPVVVRRDTHENAPGSNPRARTRLYRDEACLWQDFLVTDIAEHLADPASVVWLDLCRPAATSTWSTRSSGCTSWPSLSALLHLAFKRAHAVLTPW